MKTWIFMENELRTILSPIYWTKKDLKTNKYNSTITNKEATLALEALRKFIEGNEGMEDLFISLGILKNRVENNVLNKQKQLTLDQLFENDNRNVIKHLSLFL